MNEEGGDGESENSEEEGGNGESEDSETLSLMSCTLRYVNPVIGHLSLCMDTHFHRM